MKRLAVLPVSPALDAPHSIEGEHPMVEPGPLPLSSPHRREGFVPFRSFQRDQMSEERLEILRLLEAGTVTADEAATLLDALDRAALPPPNSGSAEARSAKARLGAHPGHRQYDRTRRGEPRLPARVDQV